MEGNIMWWSDQRFHPAIALLPTKPMVIEGCSNDWMNVIHFQTECGEQYRG